jgi:cobalt/nickel transport system permease protein
MHMADSLLSPEVGLGFAAVSVAAVIYSAGKLSKQHSEDGGRQVPLMGVLGAFVFAAQMINFSIPGTGSSGHLGGGMLLALVLGPHAALVTIASVLIVQALFFADGGLLALGTNIFNLGIIPVTLGVLIYKVFGGKEPGRTRRSASTIVAVVVALEIGAAAVVIQTLVSGRSDLPLLHFLGLMAGIHLPIALVEGAVTLGVVEFVRRMRPEALDNGIQAERSGTLKPLLASLLVLTIIVGTVVSWFASSNPDGLEWALAKTGVEEEFDEPALPVLDRLQQEISILPDYAFAGASETEEAQSWPAVDAGTSVSGLIGGLLTMIMITLFGGVLLFIRRQFGGVKTE